MKTSRISSSHRQRGVALIIMLAFLVLLSGLVVAFFSRAMSERQVSDSSANQTKVELFAQGAVETLIGDLKQEMAAGSVAPAATPSPAPKTDLFFPKTAATAVAYRVGVPTGDALPNLVKRSAYQQPFFTGTDYDAANYPPADRAANVSTTSLSQNARSWSTARWNKAFLLPKQNPASDTDSTPLTGPSGFTAPDWVLVSRDGSNPKTWSSTLANNINSAFVTGRYAYTIYDEGGLLDMNVAGYPTGVTAVQAGYKSALAFADLTQLLDSTGQPLLKQSEIDSLIAWRNYASTQAPAEFPTPGFTAASGLNYFKSIASNTKGFLTAGNSALHNNQSDRMLAGRQQLMKLLLSGISSQAASAAGKTERARLQQVLQYLGTSGRSLDQPSFAPAPLKTSTLPNGRPAVKALAAGGNDAVGGDDLINPSFLTVRVGTAFMRLDGTESKIGEPLIAARFALNRLAWLTYKGPSATRTQTETDIAKVIEEGIPWSYLQLGTAANIQKYFGLTWDATNLRWNYVHGKNGTNGPVRTLSQVGTASRDADFFELIKAGVAVGSIAKGASTGTAGTPGKYQEQKDTSVDAAIIQIAVNMIDQFDGDGFPTRIIFDDGTWPQPQEYRGVEDLPYFYRLRGALMKVHDSTPSTISGQPSYKDGSVWYGPPMVTDAGIGAAFQIPEIWNPHAWNSASATLGPRPTQFRLTAVDAPPSQEAPSNPDPNQILVQAYARYNTVGTPAYQIPGAQTCPPSTAPQKVESLTQQSTELTFTIPTNRLDLFREPTLLNKPNVPMGSSLKAGANNAINIIPALAPYRSNGGLKSDAIIPESAAYTNTGATDDRLYLGIYLGAFPLRWKKSIADPINPTNPSVEAVYSAGYALVSGAGKDTITYRLQYQDASSGAWLTYDEKYTRVIFGGQTNATSNPNFDNSLMAGDGVVLTYADPRASRFGTIQNQNSYASSAATLWMPVTRNLAGSPYAGAGSRAGWAGNATGAYNTTYRYAAQQNAMWTMRPDVNSGFSANGFSGTGAIGWYGMASAFRPGVLSQNNPLAENSLNRFNPPNVGYNGGEPGVSPAQYFADPDGVVRRGMSAYLQPDTAAKLPAATPPAGAATGNPQSVAYTFSAAGVATPILDAAGNPLETPSRPVVLNRPFRTVAELGHVYSGTPWRNLDFITPESGNAALLDVFCIQDHSNPNGLIAGKVNLNTRQAPVLQAVLAGVLQDELIATKRMASTGIASAMEIAAALVARTSDITAANVALGSGPLTNLSELTGKWMNAQNITGTTPAAINGGLSYSGFSGTEAAATAPAANPKNLSNVLSADVTAAGYNARVLQRYRESALRALSSVGNTRVWNLMIDLVAQTGRYPVQAKGLADFVVQGEQRWWVHLTIDRFTGEVIDQQVEVVKE